MIIRVHVIIGLVFVLKYNIQAISTSRYLYFESLSNTFNENSLFIIIAALIINMDLR